MTENRSLRATAIIICIFSVLIAALSGLCSLIFTMEEPKSVLGFFAIGAIGFVPFGLLAIAMIQHIRRGPNLASEIIAGLVGLILTVICLFGFRSLAGTTGIMNLLFAIPGLLFLGWAIWSFSHRSKSEPSNLQPKSSNDPFT